MTLPTRKALAARLAAVAGEAANVEARWLLSESQDPTTLEARVLRRLAGEPLDRVLGHRGFWTLELEVTPGVLSPRADTETIVRTALDLLPANARACPRILDLGVGSGAILLALLAELPRGTGVGVDASDAALEAAARNARTNGLADRVSFLRGSWDAALGRTFDLVVSNPPYIPSGDIATLDREVRDHDPHLALDGGPDGLDCYRALVPELGALLAPDGLAVLEIGIGQADSVSALATGAGLCVLEIRPDFGGVPRAVALAQGKKEKRPPIGAVLHQV